MSCLRFEDRLPCGMRLAECDRAHDDEPPGAARAAVAAPRVDVDAGGSQLSLDQAITRLPGGQRIGPFDLRLAAGERVAILGPSGAGKSTLLQLMSGERAPHEGRVTLAGRPLADWDRIALARRRAVLPQSHSVAFGLAVDLVVALGRVARGLEPAQDTIVRHALAQAHASHLAGRRFDTLSGGEQARVQLARVFAQLWDENGALLLVDEPLAALDPGLQFELSDAIERFAAERGHALVAVLHDINQALHGFNRLWLLERGRLAADLPSGRAAVRRLEALYGIGLRCVEDAHGRLAVLPTRRPDAAAAAP